MCVCVCVLDFVSFCCSQCVPIKGMLLQGQNCASNANPKNTFFDLWVSKFSPPCIGSATDSCSLKNAVKQPSCSKCLSLQLQSDSQSQESSSPSQLLLPCLEVHNYIEAKTLLFESFLDSKAPDFPVFIMIGTMSDNCCQLHRIWDEHRMCICSTCVSALALVRFQDVSLNRFLSPFLHQTVPLISFSYLSPCLHQTFPLISFASLSPCLHQTFPLISFSSLSPCLHQTFPLISFSSLSLSLSLYFLA